MPDHDEMLGNPNTYATTGFGYLGIAICNSCYQPNHIFVESSFNREFCTRCHREYGENYNGFPVLIPNVDTHSIMTENLHTCLACEKPEFADDPRWVLIEAYLADKETVVMAHKACTRKPCGECTTVYLSVVNRQWRHTYTVPSSSCTSTTSVEGYDYCDSCISIFWEENNESDYFTCECCDWLTHYDNSGWFNGTRYCTGCIDNNVYNCNNCGESLWDGNDHDCTTEDEEEDDSSLIHSYSYKPSPYFFGEGKYHFGFELEVEARSTSRHDGAVIAQNTLGGHAYLKEDGSLNDGFEIVTHPHTLDQYHTEFNWAVLDKLKSEGYRSWNTNTCGLHVHISRTAFGEGDPWDRSALRGQRSQRLLKRQSHELRFMKLIYDNQRQVERISGRSSDRYASFGDKGNLVQKVKFGNQGNGRFSAINTENDTTIEVRVFRGSLRKERVLSAIEFVHASVEYTRDIKVTSKNHALSWLKFTGYVAANAEQYPNLVTIMSESFERDTATDSDDN